MIHLRAIRHKSLKDMRLAQKFARNNDLLNYGYVRDEFAEKYIEYFRVVNGNAVNDGKLVMKFITLRGQVIGHIWVKYKPATARVENLYIAGRYRGRGYGKVALQWAEQAARERGYTKILVGSSVANRRSRRFYAREGWRRLRKSHSGKSFQWAKALTIGARV
ncbi:MAG: GNAT family N-acetyltransferase [Bdellovibrionales bacterium]